MKTSLIACFIFISALATACGPKMIPGLDIEVPDTPDNRALLSVMEKFQRAYETKDVDALLALASPEFYETCGSSDTDDDYNFEGLREHFTEHFKLIEDISLSIALKDVNVEDNKALIDYRFLARYRMNLPSGEQWQIKDDINRMELGKEKGRWKVRSGM